MVLDELVACIELLQARMRQHNAALRENETRTRMALIDPLLHALGWDVSDPDVVTPEYKVSYRWADYALLRPEGRPAATLEAKKLGEALVPHRMQMLNYANASGIDYAGLTDGNHWELYDVFKRGQLEERRILEISVAHTPTHESALKLLMLWRPNLESRQPVAANPPILDRVPTSTQDPPPGVVTPPTPPPESPDWVALSQYTPPSGAPCPVAIKFWDGNKKTLSRWNEVLTFVVEKLYAERLLTINDAPIQWSKGTYSVHTEPVHPTGKPFANYKSIDGTPLFVNVNLNAGQVRENAKKLLQHFGKNPAVDVFLQVAR